MQDFDFSPTLVGDQITLRPLRKADWPGLFAAASDPLIWAQHPAWDRYQESVFRDWFDAAINSNSAFVFIDQESDTIVGSSRYYSLDPALREIEIGWTFLARSHWGGSANRDVKTLMLNHALKSVETVIFWVGQTNHRSRGAMLKIGGVLRDGVHHREIAGDAPHVIYEITRECWANR